MAYCTVDDVQSYLPHFTIDTTSQPTKEQVSNMCRDVSDTMIDPVIRNYITLPLEDRVGLAYLNYGARVYVLARVYEATMGFIEKVSQLQAEFDSFMTKLRTNNAILIQPNNAMPKVAGSTAPRTLRYPIDDEKIF